MYTRSNVPSGKTITLRAVFTDSAGQLIDPDTVPNVYLYDTSYERADIDDEVTQNSLTGDGPHPSTKISTGFYECEYTVPVGSDEGSWHDLWIAAISGVETHQVFTFRVFEEPNIAIQTLKNNQLIVLTLDGSIADIDGNQLYHKQNIAYSTKYKPLYASPELVRAEVGPWIDFIPDDTLNLLIHWASKEADAITPKTLRKLHTVTNNRGTGHAYSGKSKNKDMYAFARTKFVIYDAAVRALLLPAAATSHLVTGGTQTKSLGDLLVKSGGGGLGHQGLTKDQIDELRKLRKEWERVVNAGGTIMPGQSLDPSWAVRGIASPERRQAGRLWEEQGGYSQPGANTKTRKPGRLNWKNRFKGR